jgi:hypothetical protein
VVYPGGHWPNVIAYLPPLVVDEQVETAVAITDAVLTELA